MLEQLYTSTKTITFGQAPPVFMAYLESWDALALYNYPRFDKVFRDGTQVSIGSSILGYLIGGRQGQGGGFFWARDLSTPISCYGADEITGQIHYSDILNPTWGIPLLNRRIGDLIDDRAGYFLNNAGSGGHIQIFRLADGYTLGNMYLSGGPWFDFLAPAGKGRALACAKGSGVVAMLDYINRVWLWKGKVRPFLCATYDISNDLVVTLEYDRKIRLYLTTPAPAVLSAPAFVPAAGQIIQYHGYKVRTRLTGDAGEVCPGYSIEWAISGNPPKGYLEKQFTLTDQDGYAENFYFSPADGATGQEEFLVKVTI